MPSNTFLSAEEKEQIVTAIKNAEGKSPGEIKVYFEKRCNKKVEERITEIFHRLKMHETELRTGVLIYVAYLDKVFAILGDKGIYEKVPVHFWDETRSLMEIDFREGRFAAGLIKGINLSGEQLRKYFGPMKENTNEISDDIIIADD